MLNRDQCIPWRKIAVLDDYRDIPPGTLAAIAKGYPIPRKWYRRLGLQLYLPAPACPRCGKVHVTRRCTERQQDYRDLWEMPVAVLRWKLEHREDYA